MKSLLLVSLGGAIGSACRYLSSKIINNYFHSPMPWGTIFVNLLGCFLVGIIWELATKAVLTSPQRLMIMVGFLGAFTTFSTYGAESFFLFKHGDIKYALYNILINNFFGILMVLAGSYLTHTFFKLFLKH